MEIRKIGRSSANVISTAEKEKRLASMRKEHEKLVKGKFEFLDANGGWLEFTYRIFPEDLLMTYKFVHGEVCEIPLGLVKHLNNTQRKIRTFGNNNGAQRGNELPERGLPSSYGVESRVRFTPLEVM